MDKVAIFIGGSRALKAGPALLALFLAGASVDARDSLGPAGLEAATHFASTEGREAVKEVMAANGATSLALALVNGDSFVWAEGFGIADVEPGMRGDQIFYADAETRYGIGGISKLVSTIAVMKLAEQGLLDLDDPVSRHLPNFRMASPGYAGISIRMLLCHSSGLPGTDWRNLYSPVPFADYADQVLAALSTQHLHTSPGFMGSASDDGFTILEELVRVVSGRAFVTFVEEEILDPLGMTQTEYPGVPRHDYPIARAFAGRNRLPMEFTNAHAAGGLISTPADMARLITMLLNGGILKEVRILSEDSVQEMGRAQNIHGFDPFPSPLTAFGLGWDSVTHPALKKVHLAAWSIAGGTLHYGSSLILVPGERMGIFVAGVTGMTAAAATSIAERILLRALVEHGRLPEMPPPAAVPVSPEVRVVPPGMAAVHGVYASREAPYRVGPGRSIPGLSLDRFDPGRGAWQRLAEDLTLREDGWFTADGEPEISYRFEAAGGRQYMAKRWLSRFHLNVLAVAEKIAPEGKLSADWAPLRGGTWLLVNEVMEGGHFERFPRLELLSLPGLEELLFVKASGFYPIEVWGLDSPGCVTLRIPGPFGRDMDEPWPQSRRGEIWMRCGSRLYRPMDPVPSLCPGRNEISIGAEGLVEWRRVPPSQAAQTLHLSGFSHWKLFDNAFKVLHKGSTPGTVAVPAGSLACLLVVGGEPRGEGTVELKREVWCRGCTSHYHYGNPWGSKDVSMR